MPQSDLNLVPKEVRDEAQKSKALNSINISGVAFFVICIAALVGSFVYETLLLRQVAAIKIKGEETKKEILLLKDTEARVRILSEKSKSLEKIFARRLFYSELLKKLKNVTPENIAIEELLVVSPKEIRISGSTSGFVALSDFLQKIVEEKEVFKSTSEQTASTDKQSGKTNFSVTVFLKENFLNKE